MFEINNLTSSRADNGFFKKIAKKVLMKERNSNLNLSIALVGPNIIKGLNKRYRKKNRPTDVLSFTYNKGSGEVVICPQVIRENAKKFRTTFKKELDRVLIHGILHLLGYDHEKSAAEAKKMEKKQNYYLSLMRY